MYICTYRYIHIYVFIYLYMYIYICIYYAFQDVCNHNNRTHTHSIHCTQTVCRWVPSSPHLVPICRRHRSSPAPRLGLLLQQVPLGPIGPQVHAKAGLARLDQPRPTLFVRRLIECNGNTCCDARLACGNGDTVSRTDWLMEMQIHEEIGTKEVKRMRRRKLFKVKRLAATAQEWSNLVEHRVVKCKYYVSQKWVQ